MAKSVEFELETVQEKRPRYLENLWAIVYVVMAMVSIFLLMLAILAMDLKMAAVLFLMSGGWLFFAYHWMESRAR